MKRPCLWLCTLTAATAATVSDAYAFTLHGPGAHGLAHIIAGPELRGPGGTAPAPIKPPVPPSNHYSFSGNSFNLSVTKNGRSPPPPPPSITAPGGSQGPGFFERLFNWW